MRIEGTKVIWPINLKNPTTKPYSDQFIVTGVMLKLIYSVLETEHLFTISFSIDNFKGGGRGRLHQHKQLAERGMLPR